MKKLSVFYIVSTLLLIFFLKKIPEYENTLLRLNKYSEIKRDYPIYNDDTALFILTSTNLQQNLYIKELKKLDNIWIGNTYNYKEAYKKNSGFQWLEDDSQRHNLEYNRIQKEIEYNKYIGYFIIKNGEEIYGLSEEEVKKILNISSLKLKNPEKYMKKYGEREILTQFNQDLLGKLLKIPISYGSDKFKKGSPVTAPEINKLNFTKNLLILYLISNLVITIIFFLKNKNLYKSLKKYRKN